MSTTVVNSPKKPDSQPLPGKDLIGGETFSGRLELMQNVLARVLRARFGGKHLNIMDIGIGDGAATLIQDLPGILKAAGVQSATIIGVDLSRVRVEMAGIFYEKARMRGLIPEGISLHFEPGDITATRGSPMQLSAVASRLKDKGIISGLDLATSFNLLENPTAGIQTLTAMGEMASALDPKGLGVIGNGQATRFDPAISFKFKVFGQLEPGDNKITVNMGQDFLDAFGKLRSGDQEKHLDEIAGRILAAA